MNRTLHSRDLGPLVWEEIFHMAANHALAKNLWSHASQDGRQLLSISTPTRSTSARTRLDLTKYSSWPFTKEHIAYKMQWGAIGVLEEGERCLLGGVERDGHTLSRWLEYRRDTEGA